MPLIKCPDCGKEISTLAKSCPNCGRPMNEEKPAKDYTSGEKLTRCPVCGGLMDDSDRITVTNGENKKTAYRCIFCHTVSDKPWYSQYNIRYYWDKAEELYGNGEYKKVLLDELKQNPLFNEQMHVKAEQRSKSFSASRSQASTSVPKCPTCGSTNITKISATSKVVGATMFGLFSKTARSQFKCKKCGYKW